MTVTLPGVTRAAACIDCKTVLALPAFPLVSIDAWNGAVLLAQCDPCLTAEIQKACAEDGDFQL